MVAPLTGSSANPQVAGNIGRETRRDAILYFPAALIPSVIGAVSTIVFTRMFLPTAWGYYALAMSVVQLAVAAQASWLERSTIRFLSAEHAAEEAAERAADAAGRPGTSDKATSPWLLPLRLTGLNTLAFLVAGIGVSLGIALSHRGTTAIAFTTVLFGAASIASSGLSAVQKATLRVWSSSRAAIVASICGFLLALAAVELFGARPVFLILGPALGMVIGTVMLGRDTLGKRAGWASSFKQAPRSEHLEQRPRVAAKTYLLWGLPITGFYIAGWLLNLSDRFLIFGFRGAAEAGIYSPNYSLGSLVIGLVAGPITAAATTRILRLSDTATAPAIQETVKQSCRDYLLIAAPIAIWLAVCSHDIASVLLGTEFRDGSSVIPLVGGGTLLWSLGMFGHKGLEIKNRTVSMLSLAVACCALNIALNVVLVPRFGFVAAGWTTFGCFGLYPVLAYLATRNALRWLLPWRTILWLGVGAVAATLLVRLGLDRVTSLGPLGRAAVGGVVTVGVMAGVLLLAREISVGTIVRMGTFVRTRFRRGRGD
jgi:O-antigen/teichoic acid export membrane protein